jgi:isopentenyldiphosphate isomerase
MRSWSKPDSPGLIDISVGGHAKSGISVEDTAYSEMAEELGVRPKYLVGNRLESVGGYEHYNERKEGRFHNAEWRAVFVGELPTDNLSKIGFNDDEVVGLYLCSVRQAAALLEQTDRIASALKCSLPKVLEYWGIPVKEPTAPGS